MQTISVSLTCVFDNTNDRIGAQTYFMNKLNALKDKSSFNLTRASVVQWSDPTTNTAQVFVKDSKNYYRYTAVAECSYKTSDDYLTVQNEIASIFNDDYMNIQNIDITGLSYEPSDDELTLEQLRAKKLNELTETSHQFDDQLVCENMIINSSLGFRANADLRSQNNIDGLIASNVEPVTYCDADNEFHSLTLEQLKVLKSEVLTNGQNLYAQKWELREKINQATTKEELQSIQIIFTMMNFN